MTGDDQPAVPAADLDWAVRVQRLEAEVAGMRRAMASRGVIEQAKGVLAERLGCSPEDAFTHLSTMSQRSNVRLADVAAGLLASMGAAGGAAGPGSPTTRDAPPGERPHDGATSVGVTDIQGTDDGKVAALQAPAGAVPAHADRGGTEADYASAYRAVAAAVAAARDLPEIAEAVRACGLAPDLVAIYDAGDLGKPRAIAISRHAAGEFDASGTDVVADLALAALSGGHPVWRVGGGGVTARLATYPLRAGQGVVGALAFGWLAGRHGPYPFTAGERGFLGALAPVVQRAAAGLFGARSHPITAALDLGYGPGLLLQPVRDDAGRVVDFLIEHASIDVPDMAGLSRAEQVGRRLLDTYPHLGKSGVFDAYRQVLDTGDPWIRGARQETVVLDGAPTVSTVRRRAIRAGTGLLVTWHCDDDRVRQERQLRRMEALGHFGWADWDLVGRQAYWSPGMFRIFGRDPSRDPVAFGSLPDLVRDADRDAMVAMVNAIGRGQAAGAEFELRHPDAGRHIRLIAEPLPAGDGRVIGVLAVAQDLTEVRTADERMLRVQAQLAEQRLNLAAQRQITRELRRVLYPGPAIDVRAGGVRVAGRHAAPDDDLRLRGDFCDCTLLDDGHILFAIGDSFGSGARAGEVLARLLYPARALGNAGTTPAGVLRILNADLNRDEPPPLASMVVGRYCPVDRTVTWAQGGHLPPVRLRERKTAMIERPAGLALGLSPAPEFAQRRLTVRDHDMIVWMTDGMVFDRQRPDSDPWPGLRRSLAAARRDGGIDDVLALCRTDAAGDEACILVLDAPGDQGNQPAGASARGGRGRAGSCTSSGCAPDQPASSTGADSARSIES